MMPTLRHPGRKWASVRQLIGWVSGGHHGRLWPGQGLAAVASFLVIAFLLWALGAGQVAQAAASARDDSAPARPKAGKPSARPKATSVPARAAAATPAVRSQRKPVSRVVARPAAPSVGQLSGLHKVDDELDLKSAVALVIDRETDEVLFSKNPSAVLPIASITKLMTALVVVQSGESLDEPLTVTPEDLRATAGSNSRRQLAPGTQLTRGEMLRLALMASENRAAHVLGRSHPGGVAAFVEAMNAKARLLGMHDTRYVEPTGLSSDNRSSAQDLARLVRAASEHPIIREYSTTGDAMVANGRRQMQFRNTNGLVHNPDWDIAVQKTGYIAAAGRCLVMQAQMAGRQLILVLLDSAGRYSRIGDAERLRRWLFDRPEAARPRAESAGIPISSRHPVGSAAPVAAGPLTSGVLPEPAERALDLPGSRAGVQAAR